MALRAMTWIFGIERGADRQTALVQLLLAVALEDVAADLLGEILAGEGVGAVRGGW